jgi:hypothetical protein
MLKVFGKGVWGKNLSSERFCPTKNVYSYEAMYLESPFFYGGLEQWV